MKQSLQNYQNKISAVFLSDLPVSKISFDKSQDWFKIKIVLLDN